MEKLNFAAFVDKQNAAAPYEQMQRAFGIDDEGDALRDPIESVIAVVTKAIARSETAPTIQLRDILRAELSPILTAMQNGNGSKKALSMLDVVTTGLVDDKAIKNFLKTLGVNIDSDRGFQYICGILSESVQYYNDRIYTRKTGSPRIHDSLAEVKTRDDVYGIFRTAAGKGKKMLTPQACALLRIAAVFNYIERNPQLSLIDDVERHITKLFEPHVREHKDGFVYTTGDPEAPTVNLADFTERKKMKWRVVDKLLHQPANRESKVLDYFGARFVTKSHIGTIRLIYLLFFDPHNAIFPWISIRIDRTKNTVLNPHKIAEALSNSAKASALVMQLSEGDEVGDSLRAEREVAGAADTANSHTDKNYGKLKFTLDPIIETPEGLQFEFPIEIQVEDSDTAEKNAQGYARHERYVRRQRKTIRERLIRNNLLEKWRARNKPLEKPVSRENEDGGAGQLSFGGM